MGRRKKKTRRRRRKRKARQKKKSCLQNLSYKGGESWTGQANSQATSNNFRTRETGYLSWEVFRVSLEPVLRTEYVEIANIHTSRRSRISPYQLIPALRVWVSFRGDIPTSTAYPTPRPRPYMDEPGAWVGNWHGMGGYDLIIPYNKIRHWIPDIKLTGKIEAAGRRRRHRRKSRRRRTTRNCRRRR